MENIKLEKYKEKPLPTSDNDSTPQEIQCTDAFNITDIIGEDGRWQRRIFYIILFNISTTFHHLGISFLAFPVDYWCSRPDGTNISLETWKHQFLPNITRDGEIFHSQCEMFTLNHTTEMGVNNVNETEKCKSWEYSTDYHSIVQQWDMVCDKTWLLSMSQSLYMLGFFVAVFFTGQMSDLFGRKLVSIINAFILFIAIIGTAFSSSFTMFLIFRCFVGMGQAGMDLSLFVLMTEVFGSSCRATYLMLNMFSYCLGYILLPVIAWLLSDWFYLQLSFALPCLICICFFWFLPESPRWLLSKGHIERALSIIKEAIKVNGIVVEDLEQKIENIYRLGKKRKEREQTVTFIDLFKTPNIRKKTLYLFFIWITLAFTYYGLSFYSTELYGNKFLNFFISAVIEIPTTIYCVLTANRFGRKNILFLSILVGGISCLGFIVTPKGYEVVQNILAMSGKLFVGAAFNIIYIFSAEIFPTVARNSGIGSCSMVARIGSALSPFMKDLGQVTNPSVPLVMFGALCVISSLFLLKLPETSHQPIPETLHEAEITVPKPKKIFKLKHSYCGED